MTDSNGTNTSGHLYQTNLTANQLIMGSSGGVLTPLATANSAILATDSSGVPSLTTASGNWNNTSRTAFSAYLGTSVTNATGNGATFTLGTTQALTKLFDQGTNFNTNGTFTAPVTGIYLLCAFGYLTNCTVSTGATIKIVTTSKTYSGGEVRTANSGDVTVTLCAIANMSSGNTATVQLTGFGEAGNTNTVLGSGTQVLNGFQGFLIC